MSFNYKIRIRSKKSFRFHSTKSLLCWCWYWNRYRVDYLRRTPLYYWSDLQKVKNRRERNNKNKHIHRHTVQKHRSLHNNMRVCTQAQAIFSSAMHNKIFAILLPRWSPHRAILYYRDIMWVRLPCPSWYRTDWRGWRYDDWAEAVRKRDGWNIVEAKGR